MLILKWCGRNLDLEMNKETEDSEVDSDTM